MTRVKNSPADIAGGKKASILEGMNDFQNMESGQAQLKDFYADADTKARTGRTPFAEALRRRRLKLAQSQIPSALPSEEDLMTEELATQGRHL